MIRKPMQRRFVTWLVLLMATALAGAVGMQVWHYQSQVDNSGGQTQPPASFRVAWAFEAPGRGGVWGTPKLGADRLYVAAIHDARLRSTGAIHCLAADTGRILWTFDDDGRMKPTCSSPSLVAGRLYFGEGMHRNFVCKLYCLDAASGRKCWDFEVKGHVESSPYVAEGQVFFGAGDDGVYCLDAASGKMHWHFQSSVHIDSSPAFAAGRVFVGSGISLSRQQTEALCLDAATGKVLWRLPTELPVWGSPAVFGEHVFFGLGNGRFLEPPQPPAQASGAVLCLAAANRQLVWKWGDSDAVFGRPAVDDAHVCFGSRDGCCWCLDRVSGQRSWKTDLGSPVIASPCLIGRHVYVVSSAGRVCRLDAETGTVERTFDLAAATGTRPEVYASPVVVPENGPGGGCRIIVGAELRNGASSAAVVYCLLD
jgi:outer membrane protein assembly factor BamB